MLKNLLLIISGLLISSMVAMAVEIPLESLTPARIGYVDLQRVFDSYPEKSFAEGDLLRDVEKRKRDLSQRQALINTLRQQVAADEAAFKEGRTGAPVIVPPNNVPDLTPAPAAPAVAASTSTAPPKPAAVEPYPLEDPLAGLPGHEASGIVDRVQQGAPATGLPGMKGDTKKGSLLDQLATGSPVTLSPEATSALQKRIDENTRLIERKSAEFRNFRANAIADMKVLQTQKTYGVMSKIYAVLQTLARDEGVTVVLDKAYVLYGEDTVDLSEKLVLRLQAENL